jgi:UDP:flavonoid glycosyltransferase YjiC (YdhE family)
MSRVVFVTWDGGGNVVPAVAIARELRDRGDQVRFLGQAGQRAAIERAGFGFAAYRHPGPWTATGKRNAITNAVGFLRLSSGRSLGRDLTAELKAHPADLVVVDCLLYGALDAASRAGIPYAVLVHSLFGAVEQKMAYGAPGVVARLLGLDPWKLWSKANAVVVTTLDEIDVPSRNRRKPALRYTGPALPLLGGRDPASSSPPATILISLSTTYIPGQAQALQSILDAVADLPLEAVVTTGPAVEPGDLRASANVELRRFVPHAEMMSTVSMVVGHGGHATTMLALANDLPMVVMPMNPAFDQHLIGRRIQELGAGVTLGSSASPVTIRAAIKELLGDEKYRIEAARLGAAIRASDGTRTAADLLQSLPRQAGR